MGLQLREIRISFGGRCVQALHLAVVIGIPNPEGKAVREILMAVGCGVLPQNSARRLCFLAVKRFMFRRESQCPIEKVSEFMDGGGRGRDIDPFFTVQGKPDTG